MAAVRLGPRQRPPGHPDLLSPVFWLDGRVVMLDQRRLPDAAVWTAYDDAQDVVRAIREMAVGAGPPVGSGVARGQWAGTAFVEAGEGVCEGLIVGLQKRPGDSRVNVCSEKKQANIRSSTSDRSVRLTPASRQSLEQSLDFLSDDELLEVTPKHLRLRKRHLTDVDQSRASRTSMQPSPHRVGPRTTTPPPAPAVGTPSPA